MYPAQAASTTRDSAAAGRQGQPDDLCDISHRRTSIAASTSSGTSSRSGSLRCGTNTVVRPARCAASSFCLTPPIGSTRPFSVTSPVIPTSDRTGRPVAIETRAVTMVTPAEGPSLGTAPAGTWTWMSRSSAVRSVMPSSSAWART